MKSLMKSNGFTLIEILVALFILGFALLALAGLMVATTKNNSFGGLMTEAATYVQDKLEEFQAMPTDNINSGNDERTGCRGIRYARNWNVVTGTDEVSKTITKTITLSISWADKNNHSIRVVSVIRRQLIE